MVWCGVVCTSILSGDVKGDDARRGEGGSVDVVLVTRVDVVGGWGLIDLTGLQLLEWNRNRMRITGGGGSSHTLC